MSTSVIPAVGVESQFTYRAANAASAAQTRRPLVYFFLDFSNIAISAGQVSCDQGDGLLQSRQVRLHCGNLRKFVERDRIWSSGYAAAAMDDQLSPIKRHFDAAGIQFDICERGRNSGTEQNVDHRIQREMYRLLSPTFRRGTVVLATGDGDGHDEDRGFLPVLEELRRHGYAIEVVSWRHSFNQALRNWASLHGRVIELDEFYHELTFVKGGRKVATESQLYRKLARRRVA